MISYASFLKIYQLESMGNVEAEFSKDRVLQLLHDFFSKKSDMLLQENSFLISRWSRFCRTSSDVQKFKKIFDAYQSKIKAEYSDSIERYERLHEILKAKEKEARILEVY